MSIIGRTVRKSVEAELPDPEEGTSGREKNIEHALEKSEARFRQVVESAPNAMVMVNASGQIDMINAQAERMFGYPRNELLGQLMEVLEPPRFRGHHAGLRTLFFHDPQSRPVGAGRDLFGLRKDGSEFPVEIGLSPIETEEGTMVLSSVVDISERKQREVRLQAALDEKDLLLGEIHHRVKNNLQVICSLLALQSAKIEDKTALLLLNESQIRIRSMALIHQILYESKEFGRVDFRTFLDTLVPILVSSYSVDPARVALSISTMSVFLPIRLAIPCALIVNELISNALKHAFPGELRGEIRIGLAMEAESHVILSVADDGIGIPDALDFANATTLGLQLVTLLAEQLGSKIELHRARPTCFTVRFAVDK